MDYKLSRALAILRAAYAEAAGAGGKARPPAMADLEIAGFRTGALNVPHPPPARRGGKSRAA